MKAVIDEEGAIVIPPEVLEKLGLRAGDEVIVILDEEGLRVVKREPTPRSGTSRPEPGARSAPR